MPFTSLHPSAADPHPEPGTGSPGQRWVAMAAAQPESARQLRLTPTTSHIPLPAPRQTQPLDGLHSSGHVALVLGVPWAWGDRAGSGGDSDTGMEWGHPQCPLAGGRAPEWGSCSSHPSIN